MQTYLETQENLSALHKRARGKAKFGLDATTGRYLFSRWKHSSVALDAAGIDSGISTEEIVEFVRKGRERL
ncbi:MAG TPA: hypothetical protein VGB02_02140 [Pyrinomonadaceae bacterium]|jgi:hypothetical protein